MNETLKMLTEQVECISKALLEIYSLDLTEEERERREEEGEPCDLFDYLSDGLDYEFRIGLDGNLRSVKIMLAFGGPNIYLDTANGTVLGYWGCETAKARVSDEICTEIEAIFDDIRKSL